VIKDNDPVASALSVSILVDFGSDNFASQTKNLLQFLVVNLIVKLRTK
jgi:hypothetical protein